MKTLVTYFSAEAGKTASIAKQIAEAVSADLFELQPDPVYTKADLNYLNPLSRCNKEKFGGKDVPVKALPEHFDEYDRVYVGFPIWYGGAPAVVETFCKLLAWNGKEVVLFATSAASPIGKTSEKLAPCLTGAKILDAKRYSANQGDEAAAWAKSLA